MSGTGDASPRASLQGLAAAEARLNAIAFRLAAANVALCRDQRGLLGATFHAADQYDAVFRPVAIRLFGLGKWPAALAVAPGSPAAAAGLEAGDAIVAVNGLPLPVPRPTRGAVYDSVGQLAARLDDPDVASAPRLTVQRGATTQIVTITPVPGCGSRVQLIPGAHVAASSDGRWVTITTTLEARLPSDDQLALVVAHEMAHNGLLHRPASAGLARSAVRDQEIAADDVAMRMIARAGFDPDRALAFWTGLGRLRDPGLLSDGTHPRWRQRLAAGRATAAALAARVSPGPAASPAHP